MDAAWVRIRRPLGFHTQANSGDLAVKRAWGKEPGTVLCSALAAGFGARAF